MITAFVSALLGAEADAVCGAEYGMRSEERVNARNGYRHRDSDTRVGTVDVAIPKLRSGSYFPDWLLERRHAEAALVSVVATSYLLGASTRRMKKLVATLGIERLSKSQVSNMAKDLDEQVEALRTRPLDAGPYTFATLPGAAWQRCRTHYAANLMSATPKTRWCWVKAKRLLFWRGVLRCQHRDRRSCATRIELVR